MTATVIAFASAKGGAGKTVTATSLGVVLADIGRRTLLIDCDAATNGLTLLVADDVIEARGHPDDAPIRVRDATTGRDLIQTRAGHWGSVSAVTVGYLGGREVVVSGGGDGMVRVWRAPDYAPYAELGGRWGPANTVAVSSHGYWLAAGFADGTICVWDVVKSTSNLALRYEVKEHRGPVSGLAISADDSLLASSGDDGTVRLWDPESGSARCVLADHRGPVNGVAIGFDGTWVAAAGSDKIVSVWNVADGSLRHRLGGHEGPVTAVATFNRSAWLASGGADGKVRLWSGADGSHQQTLTGHRGPVNALAVRHDGAWVASAGSDGTVRLWNSVSGAPINVLAGPEHVVSAVALGGSEGHDFVVSGSGDDNAMLGTFDTRRGAARAPRPLRVEESLDVIPATYVMHQTGGGDAAVFEEDLGIAIDRYRWSYDFIILDAQPGSDGYALAAVRFAHRVVIVTEFDALSSLGVARLRDLAGGLERLRELVRVDAGRTWVLFNKVHPELERDVEDYVRDRQHHLPYLRWDIEVVLATARRALAVDPGAPTPYALSIAEIARSLVPPAVGSELARWIEEREPAVWERSALKPVRQADPREAELAAAAARSTLQAVAIGRTVAAGAAGMAATAAAGLAYLTFAGSPLLDPTPLEVGLAAVGITSSIVGGLAWRVWPGLAARRHGDSGEAAAAERRLEAPGHRPERAALPQKTSR
jgi:WD40 repeat protein/MinD-like ATPase involved in chromosome partitioning or flagellar assembly